MIRSLLIVIVISTVFIGSISPSNARSSEKWTHEDTRHYFKDLSFEKQNEFISSVIIANQKDLPVQIDPYTRLVGLVYQRTTNMITQWFHIDVPYNSVDQTTVDALAKETRLNAINSLCTKRAFKMWMFEAGTIVRAEFDYASRQRMFTWTINKNDCLEAGYKYP